MKHSLHVDSVRKLVGQKPILTDVYLKCESQEIIGLLGRNGSGKTTLLNIIFGSVTAESKFVKIDGIVYDGSFNGRIAYLPQTHFIPSSLTVRKAASLFLKKGVLDEFFDDEFIRRIQHQRAGTLSGGALRYLEVRLVLFSDAQFALLDEPFSGLAPIMADKIKSLIVERSQSKGIIVSDHNFREIISIANKLYLLKEGKTHAIENPKELISYGYITEDML